MPILNYSTKISPIITAAEIEETLVRHGARAVLKNFGANGQIESMSFQVQTAYGLVPIKMPIRAASVLEVLKKEKKKNSRIKADAEQAERVAWRILKDWVEAQMALIEVGMVQIQEVFLPYITVGEQTVYQALEGRRFMLGGVEDVPNP